MTTEPKRISLYAVSGVLIAALIITGVFTLGIQSPLLKVKSGTLVVLLTDAPVSLENLTVTIDSLSALNETHKIDLDFVGEVTEVTFDLLYLSGRTMMLSKVEDMPVGSYDKIRMSIKPPAIANYTDRSGEPHINVELTVPPGHLDVKIDFIIEEGDTVLLLVDMTVEDWAAISNTKQLRPVLKASILS